MIAPEGETDRQIDKWSIGRARGKIDRQFNQMRDESGEECGQSNVGFYNKEGTNNTRNNERGRGMIDPDGKADRQTDKRSIGPARGEIDGQFHQMSLVLCCNDSVSKSD